MLGYEMAYPIGLVWLVVSASWVLYTQRVDCVWMEVFCKTVLEGYRAV